MCYAGGKFDLLAKCFGFPTSRSIRGYTSTSSSVPFGIIPDNLDLACQSFNEKNPNIPLRNTRRGVVLSFDEMYTKGQFNFNRLTGELVGFDQSCFDASVIASEFSALDPKNRNQDDDSALMKSVYYHRLQSTTWHSSPLHYSRKKSTSLLLGTISSRLLPSSYQDGLKSSLQYYMTTGS